MTPLAGFLVFVTIAAGAIAIGVLADALRYERARRMAAEQRESSLREQLTSGGAS